MSATPCPCGSGQSLAACCATVHSGQKNPEPQALMRARYSAYVLGLSEFLLASWAPSTRPAAADLQDQDSAQRRWLGLDVRRSAQLDADTAEVEFVARSRAGGGSAVRLHEISRFVRIDGRWYYLDGRFPGLDKQQAKR